VISIIDYGLGNVLAFRNVFERLNIPVEVARTCEDLRKSTKFILPGVGAFDGAVERLAASGMRGLMEEMVLRHQVPVLGVCVGMQMLAASSEEGELAGLGWIAGRVKRFQGTSLPLPHMGWNDVEPTRATGLFSNLQEQARFYFLHSYYFECHDPADALAITDYGGTFTCAVNRGNIYGVQFHPEKSHRCGVQLLKNFAEL
jgi:imidazole glycerol-phosphate synthase subunit HisH